MLLRLFALFVKSALMSAYFIWLSGVIEHIAHTWNSNNSAFFQHFVVASLETHSAFTY